MWHHGYKVQHNLGTKVGHKHGDKTMDHYNFGATGASNGLTNGVDDVIMLLGLQNQVIGAQIMDSEKVGHLPGIHGCHKGVNMIKRAEGAKVKVIFKEFFFLINTWLLVTGSNSNNKPSSFEI